MRERAAPVSVHIVLVDDHAFDADEQSPRLLGREAQTGGTA